MSIHLRQCLSILGCISSGSRSGCPITVTEQSSCEYFAAVDDESLRHRIRYILASLGIIVEDVDSIADAIANHFSQVKSIDLDSVIKLVNEMEMNFVKNHFSPTRIGFLLQSLQNFHLHVSEREFGKLPLEIGLTQESTKQLGEALELWEETLKLPTWSAIRSIWPERLWLPIEHIYSELHVLSDNSLSTRFQNRVDIKELQVSHAALAEFPTRALSIESVLTTLKYRVVLVGEPGSGKTTLVKWIAQSILSRRIDVYDFPIVVLLGQFARALRNNPSTSLLEFFLTSYCSVDSRKVVDLVAAMRALARRCFTGQIPFRILLLLDGWDEVPSNERSAVLDAIEGDSRFFSTLITTRPNGIPLSLRGERTLHIGRLQPSSMHALIQHHCDRIRQPNLYTKIVNYLYRTPSSIEVAGNPYILMLLCEVAASCEYTRTPLPKNAAGTLYKAIELLQSDLEKHSDLMHLEESVLDQMKKLAFQLSFGSEHKRYEFSVEDVGFAKTSAELDSSAIVQSRLVNKFADNVDTYFFIHARFQEFFAAWQFDQIDSDDVRIIAEHYALSQRWLEEFQFAAGLLSGERLNHFWAAVRDQSQEGDLFGVVSRTVARLLAATGLKDGGQGYLGYDIRDRLELLLRDDLHLDETAAAWVALDADSLLERVKQSRKQFSERAMEAIYRAVPVYTRRVAKFDEWLAQSGSLSSWLIGIVAPGMILEADIAQLRNTARDDLRQVDERSYALRQLGSMRDLGIVEFAISVLDNWNHPLFDDCVTSLGRIGGRQAAVALANCLISLHERPLDDITLPIYIQLGDALRIDGYGAIEPRSRDVLAAHLAGLSPDDPTVALILQPLMGVVSGQIERIVLDILETSHEPENRREAAKALQGCSDRAIIERAFRIARDDQDTKLRIMLLRILQDCEPPDGGVWLLQRLMDETKSKQERLVALTIIVNSLRQGFELPVKTAMQTFVRSHIHNALSQIVDEFTTRVIDTADILPENPVPILIKLLQLQETNLDLKLSICDKLGEIRAVEAIDILMDMIRNFMEESQEDPEGYRKLLKSLAYSISEIAPEHLLTLLDDSSTYDMPVVEVLADLSRRKGYRIYRNYILDSDGKLVGYNPENYHGAETEKQPLPPTTCIDEIPMPKVEKLKIFLASPSDVNTERGYVEKVVEEINRTVAPSRGVVLEVISSKNAFPSYGKDGQAILNEQIGNMQEYELFIGIMWNRLGTPTPRAKSGTAEEFGRAVRALIQKGRPQVWFYFREAPSHLTTKEDLRQKEEVLEFKNKFKGKGLFREYKTPANFRDQLREHLTVWLNQRASGSEASQLPSVPVKQSKKTPEMKTNFDSSTVARNSQRKTSATQTKIATTNQTSATPRKTSNSKSSTTRSTGTIQSPGNWVMLNEKFFQTESSSTQADRSIILRLSPKDMEQIAELKALHPGEFHNRNQIAYAEQHEAGIMQVSSVISESIAGKTSFSITLTPNLRTQNSGIAMEMNFNNYSADKVAELRARLLLLGESLPENLGQFFPTNPIVMPNNHNVSIKNGIFADLWANLQTQSRLFLPKAWLWAVYHLKMSQLVEDVLELQLGPINNKVMPVLFRGRRRRIYANQEPSIIKIVGNCTLNM